MKITRVVIYILVLFYVVPLYALHKGIYPVKKPHEGVNMKPKEAHNLLSNDPGNSYIVNVRSRYEYQDIGHPVGAYNIPVFFYTTEVDPNRKYRIE
jgi:hypothetical protein